jgi:Flp pilus assembly pilin Flp
MLNKISPASEKGASMVEYALLVVLIALLALFAVKFAGESLSETYSNIAVEVETAGN